MLKKRLKPVYLLFLAVPLAYFLCYGFKVKDYPTEKKTNDYFFFSVKTSKPVSLSLLDGRNTLITRSVSPGGYKDMECLGQIADSSRLSLMINDAAAGDTICFLGFNLYHNDHVASLVEGIKKKCDVKNAELIENDDGIAVVVQQSGQPVIIDLPPPTVWETSASGFNPLWLVIFAFVAIILVLLACAPSKRYFIAVLLITLLVMVIAHLTFDKSLIGRATMNCDTQLKNAEIFYHKDPFFTPEKKFSSVLISNSFSVPVNYSKDRFLRLDPGDSIINLQDLKIMIKPGFFCSEYDLASMPQKILVLNDLVRSQDKYYITGNDPYIKLSSAYFIRHLEWLSFLEQNLFLALSLLVFLVLLLLQIFYSGFDRLLIKIRFKPAYYAFLLLPLTYYSISAVWEKEAPSQSDDHLYFSAMTSKPSAVSLINGSDSVASWILDAPSYKYLHYSGRFNTDEGFFLKFDSLNSNDTIQLLSVNLFHNDHVYSIFDKNEPVCSISNATILVDNECVMAVAQQVGRPVIVHLLPFTCLKNSNTKNLIDSFVLLLFFIVFTVVVIISPRTRYFMASCVISLLMMFVYYWLCLDLQDQVRLKTSTLVKSVQFYYNNNPSFEATKIISTDKGLNIFKTNIDLSANKFLRCDVAETTKELKDTRICTKTGLIKNTWNYDDLPPEKMLLNDMVRYGNVLQVKGNDPFFVLTAAGQMGEINLQLWLKHNIFLLITIIFFLLLLLLGNTTGKQQLTAVFFTLVFVSLISYGFLLSLFSSEGLVLTAEMRYTNPRPVFKPDSSEVFVKRLDDYLKDQIPGRNNIIILNNYIEYSIFRKVLNNQNVHFGENNWMYYIGGVCRENYENRNPLTPEELKKMKDVLVARRDWLMERDIHFYLVFPTMSYAVYEEYIGPRLWRYHQKSKLEQLLEYLKLNTDLDIIDIHNPLMEAKKNNYADLYYRSNSHWTHYGAYVAYAAMIEQISRDYPETGTPLPLKDITWIKFPNYKPDLYVLIAIEKFVKYCEYMPSNDKLTAATETTYPVYPEFSSPAPAYCFHNKTINNPSVLMYGDSFGGFLLYYLTNNFSKTYFLYTHLFYPTIIEKEKPDIVIQEMADYTIYKILDQNPVMIDKKDSIHSRIN
ncbi:MAG TPA: hypothetical protein PKW80_14370 [Bacteroidales bacterium]|nr:hypothetical protein [Bacteroidales bacterium]